MKALTTGLSRTPGELLLSFILFCLCHWLTLSGRYLKHVCSHVTSYTILLVTQLGYKCVAHALCATTNVTAVYTFLCAAAAGQLQLAAKLT